MARARAGTVSELATPAAVIDLDRMHANLDRMADYARARELVLRPHVKTHKTPSLAAAQLRRGAAGVTVATARELRVMGDVADDILLAYPTVAGGRLDAARDLADGTRLTVALDSAEAARALAEAMRDAGREADVLVEIDVGMRRCGVTTPPAAVRLATLIGALDGVRFRGVMFYPGHIRDPVRDQDPALEALSAQLAVFLDALGQAGHDVAVVSGGSTPTAYRSHEVAGVTEIRPGTYIFNDRTTAAVGGCAWDDCAYTILA
ncbi:MAG: alanine racemase, partial [Longimicrobiales bacterium]